MSYFQSQFQKWKKKNIFTFRNRRKWRDLEQENYVGTNFSAKVPIVLKLSAIEAYVKFHVNTGVKGLTANSHCE